MFGGDHIRCRCVEVSLPDPVVMHSSNAVSSLVTNLINNVFTEVTGIRISKHFQIATIHFESGFNSWPCSADVATYHNRFDNMNCVFRVHGVDAGATRRFWGAKVQPILRQNLLFHCSIGMNSSRTARLCSCIEAEEYVRTLCGPPPRKALTEQNFVQAVYDSMKITARNPLQMILDLVYTHGNKTPRIVLWLGFWNGMSWMWRILLWCC